jgi:hypothetical protein
MCARQRSTFLLLAQEKGTNEKGTTTVLGRPSAASDPRARKALALSLWLRHSDSFALPPAQAILGPRRCTGGTDGAPVYKVTDKPAWGPATPLQLNCLCGEAKRAGINECANGSM